MHPPMNAAPRFLAIVTACLVAGFSPHAFARDEWVHDSFHPYEHIADHDEVAYLSYRLAHIEREADVRLLTPRAAKELVETQKRICYLERNYECVLLAHNLEKTCHSIREDLYRLEDNVLRSKACVLK